MVFLLVISSSARNDYESGGESESEVDEYDKENAHLPLLERVKLRLQVSQNFDYDLINGKFNK